AASMMATIISGGSGKGKGRDGNNDGFASGNNGRRDDDRRDDDRDREQHEKREREERERRGREEKQKREAEADKKTLVGKGQQFTNGRKNKLKPNIRYKTGEYDYFYETDKLGRISKFETDNLQLTKRKDRLSHSKNTPGKIKGQDHAGHLAGDRFGGSPKLDNLVSQLSDVNLKQYKKIEDKWAAALNETPPKKVTVDVEIVYSKDNMRPEKFIVNYTIDGKPGSKELEN
ncbi:DNA/RNA non-specific endonuclease, partial [Paenibacillus turpanensis]|uniref:DNA/RNA non-specific endonuclease n=1 Tax=Paenibacillus turpanensis TaxID=2689078 RepID=UPI001FB77796